MRSWSSNLAFLIYARISCLLVGYKLETMAADSFVNLQFISSPSSSSSDIKCAYNPSTKLHVYFTKINLVTENSFTNQKLSDRNKGRIPVMCNATTARLFARLSSPISLYLLHQLPEQTMHLSVSMDRRRHCSPV